VNVTSYRDDCSVSNRAVAVVVVLFNLVVERPNSAIDQDNSKQQNNNRWIQNVRIERILHFVSKKRHPFYFYDNFVRCRMI